MSAQAALFPAERVAAFVCAGYELSLCRQIFAASGRRNFNVQRFIGQAVDLRGFGDFVGRRVGPAGGAAQGAAAVFGAGMVLFLLPFRVEWNRQGMTFLAGSGIREDWRLS